MHNKHKLTLILSYSYDLWSGNEVAPVQGPSCPSKVPQGETELQQILFS